MFRKALRRIRRFKETNQATPQNENQDANDSYVPTQFVPFQRPTAITSAQSLPDAVLEDNLLESEKNLNERKIQKGSNLGVTVLYEPPSGLAPIVDIVFVHGLRGNSFGTWHYGQESGLHWPSDLLKVDIPDARILSFGYDAAVLHWWSPASRNSIRNHAQNLLGSVVRLREKTNTEDLALVFAIHSLGGLVVQNALDLSRSSPEAHLNSLESSTVGLLFMGTPHFGSNKARWGGYCTAVVSLTSSPNKNIIEVLERDSEMLATIQYKFHEILRLRQAKNRPISITCFYEELASPNIGMIVECSSAILPGYPSYGIHADHKGMTKYTSSHDKGYEAVAGELIRWAKDTRAMLSRLGEQEQDMKQCRSNLDWKPSVLYEILLQVLAQKHSRPLWIFLDGLDRYPGDLIELADVCTKLAGAASKKVRICISSRPEQEFSCSFDATLASEDAILKLEDHTQGDITMFATAEISRLSNLLDGSSRTRLIKSISARANGLFRWVKLASRDVVQTCISGVGDDADKLLGCLDNLPDELTELYLEILKKQKKHRDLALRLLGVVEFGKRSFTLREFAFILNPGEGFPTEKEINFLRRQCDSITGGLLEYRNGRVSFAHETVSSFIRTLLDDPMYSIHVLKGCLVLGQACILLLESFDLPKETKHMPKLIERVGYRLRELRSYSIQHWLHHLSYCAIKGLFSDEISDISVCNRHTAHWRMMRLAQYWDHHSSNKVSNSHITTTLAFLFRSVIPLGIFTSQSVEIQDPMSEALQVPLSSFGEWKKQDLEYIVSVEFAPGYLVSFHAGKILRARVAQITCKVRFPDEVFQQEQIEVEENNDWIRAFLNSSGAGTFDNPIHFRRSPSSGLDGISGHKKDVLVKTSLFTQIQIVLWHYIQTQKEYLKHSGMTSRQLSHKVTDERMDFPTPLHYAAFHGLDEVIEVLHEYGASLRSISNDSPLGTPLLAAIWGLSEKRYVTPRIAAIETLIRLDSTKGTIEMSATCASLGNVTPLDAAVRLYTGYRRRVGLESDELREVILLLLEEAAMVDAATRAIARSSRKLRSHFDDSSRAMFSSWVSQLPGSLPIPITSQKLARNPVNATIGGLRGNVTYSTRGTRSGDPLSSTFFMADPLSVAGLALAVVSLGLQVTGGITDYFDSLKSRDQDIASIIQQNDTLKKTLQVIESSISRFQNDHRTATEALRQFLDSSNDELKVLEGMVATLTTDDQGATDRRTKARNKGKKLLYPFHRPKLEQMATKLHHINATLQLGLQSLGLSVSHLGSEKLATLQVTSQTISSDLLVVQSEVSSISSPIRGMQRRLSHFETRFDDLEHLLEQLLVQGSNTNEQLQDITPALVTGRLLGKPAVLREMCDAVVTQEKRRPKRKPSVPHETAARVSTGVSRYTGGRYSCLCRHRRHVKRWNAALGSFALSHETTTERHLPGCPVTRDILEPDRTQKLALTYAGLRRLLNSAIQFSLTIRSGAGGSSFGPNFTYYPIVDSNRTPAFKMLEILGSCFEYNNMLTTHGYSEIPALWEKLVPSVVSAVLSLLQAKKASPRAVNDCNESLVYSVALCIGNCYGRMSFLPSLASTSQASPLLDLLEYLVNNKAPANDYNKDGYTPVSAMFEFGAYGTVTNPVPAAAVDLILRSNTDSAALNRRDPPFSFTKHPSTLSERNLFGHSPLHLVVGKSSILRVLVDAADIALLNWTDNEEFSALELAVSISENLPKTDIEQLCLESKHVLDSDAFEVTQRLQQTGICVPEALAVGYNESFRPIYQLVDSYDDADLLFRAGFRDTASWCNADDVEWWDISPPREPLPYLRCDENGLEDDQGYQLALLEDLIIEFEETMTSLLENPDTGTDELIDFWERIWVGRMGEVIDRLEGSDLPEDEKLAAEEIGVVWDKVGPEPPEPRPEEIGNPYGRYTIEYWLYELRKIEEECQ
ncbi:ankyrin repeat-containing protein [Fusarium sp. NRRL 25303]|nr:ankyrin repeat-containing protein [Fusarium sp. NRRL 25303]